MTLSRKVRGDAAHRSISRRPLYALPGETTEVPRYRIPEHGMDPDEAYQIVHDELMLDGNARLNLATFVSTWMEPQAARLMAETFDKNMIDKDEYPQTAELELRCVNMLSQLWHSPDHEEATGCSTTGSSEAAMLGGLALKRRWQQRQRAAGRPTDRPNLVMSAGVQVCWEKFCRYFEVEPRLVPWTPDHHQLSGAAAAAACDENTIGVVAILGVTYDGAYEPVAEIAAELDDLQARTGMDVPVHVDGASGGFVAPFLTPELAWDFRLPRVQSINASGHKYGLVYPGVGWILWRSPEALPDDLVFRVNYLGGEMPTFALNFSRPGAQIVAQYYNLLRLGREGYRRVQQASMDTAHRMAQAIEGLGPFQILPGSAIPVFAFRVGDADVPYDVFDLSRELRGRGWQVPAYTLPPDVSDVAVLRVVVRNGFSADLGELFVADLERVMAELATQPAHLRPHRAAFHH